MRKKILIAIDQSAHSRNAMNYACQLSRKMTGVDFDLYHAQPMVSQYLMEEAKKNQNARTQLERIFEQNNAAAEAFLEECGTRMRDKAVDDVRIRNITKPRQYGIAKDITLAAEEGFYDAVIIGRRGITGLQELIMGSVTANLLSIAKTVPVWIVDGQASSGGVLIAVDGSPGSLRAVDHAAHIFSESRGAGIGIVNIEPKLGDFCEVSSETDDTEELSKALLRSNEKCIADFNQKANAILEKAGIDRTAVKYFDIKKKMYTGKAILNTFKDEGYSTLVIGKTGFGQSPNMGKVSSYLVQKLSDGAVWVVP